MKVRSLVPLLALSLLACSKGASPDKVCAHLAKTLAEDHPAADKSRCKTQVTELKRKIGDDTYNKVSSCLMEAKNKAAVGKCMALAMESEGMKSEMSEYTAKSKAIEAKMNIDMIHRGARAYYMEEHVASGSMEVTTSQFPGESVGPTPPLGACCQEGGKCAPDPELWEHPTWKALMFSVEDPHYYSYEYKVNPSEERKEFTALAYGDLDCDGVYSTFSRKGVVKQGTDTPSREDLDELNPLE